MKLAEALILRADYQKRIEQLKERLALSAKVQEGEKPPENPDELMKELETVTEALLEMIKRINKTNALTPLTAAMSLSDALAVRDILMLKRNAYSRLAEAAYVSQDRYSRSEVKFYSTVNIAEIRKRMDDLAQQHRELDAKIQEMNWRTELSD